MTELQTAYAGTQNDEDLIGELVAPDPTLGPARTGSPESAASRQTVKARWRPSAPPSAPSRTCSTLWAASSRWSGRLGVPVEVGAAVLGGGWLTDGDFREARKREPGFERAARGLSPPERQALRRLLAIEVIRRAFTSGGARGQARRELNFVQLTPDAPSPIFSSNPIDQPFAVSAETKLTGIRLGHFAGFLKRSWRANDYMWGRLDAAARIVDLLVDRARAPRAAGTNTWPTRLVRGVLGEATDRSSSAGSSRSFCRTRLTARRAGAVRPRPTSCGPRSAPRSSRI